MTYSEVLDFLFNQFPQYQKVGGAAYKPGLDNITAICNHLGNPQNELKIIHVAGTNGKGSTCNLLSAVYQTAGYNVGLFTSPHLLDFRERIRFNGTPIPEEFVVNFVEGNKQYFEFLNASFFEWSTALAFSYFKFLNLDLVILETGLGGRLDATNIVTPILSVITSIGIDHTAYLGTKLTEIAKEKGGIIKEGIPVVLSCGNPDEVFNVILEIASERKSHCYFSLISDLESDLNGEYQKYNKGVVIEVLSVLKSSFDISMQHIMEGFVNSCQLTGFRGRWELLQSNPKVIADIGHNFSGVSEVVNQLAKEKYGTLRIVWGMVEDKEVDKIAQILPIDARYYISSPIIKRALPGIVWNELLSKDHSFEIFSNLSQAYSKAISDSKSDDLIFVGGSNFVVAEIISEFFN